MTIQDQNESATAPKKSRSSNNKKRKPNSSISMKSTSSKMPEPPARRTSNSEANKSNKPNKRPPVTTTSTTSRRRSSNGGGGSGATSDDSSRSSSRQMIAKPSTSMNKGRKARRPPAPSSATSRSSDTTSSSHNNNNRLSSFSSASPPSSDVAKTSSSLPSKKKNDKNTNNTQRRRTSTSPKRHRPRPRSSSSSSSKSPTRTIRVDNAGRIIEDVPSLLPPHPRRRATTRTISGTATSSEDDYNSNSDHHQNHNNKPPSMLRKSFNTAMKRIVPFSNNNNDDDNDDIHHQPSLHTQQPSSERDDFNNNSNNDDDNDDFKTSKRSTYSSNNNSIIDTSEIGGIDSHIKTSRRKYNSNKVATLEGSDNTGTAKKVIKKRGGGGKIGIGATDTMEYNTNYSNHTQMTMNLEYQDENKFVQFLRYIHIMAPHPHEKPLQKRIRIASWATLLCDFLAAIVSITTFDGVTECCGRPILSIMGDANWYTIVRVFTYVYLIMIIVEVVPVLRHGAPFHLLNPVMGFLITFAVFFDDNVAEAVTMWVIEATAVTCEGLTYMYKRRIFKEKELRVVEAQKKLDRFKKVKKKRNLMLKNNKATNKQQQKQQQRNSSKNKTSSGFIPDEDDTSSIGSFANDESDYSMIESGKVGRSVSDVHEIRLMREVRLWRSEQYVQVKKLRYHLIGVVCNIGLVVFTMLLIVMIGKSGGLCIVDMKAPQIFDSNPLEKCFDCKGMEGDCEVCDGEKSQCYYPYY